LAQSIDDLFDAFERRKQREWREARDRADKAVRDRERASELIGRKVLDAMTPVIERIRERGHMAEISSHLDAETPHAVVIFTPKRLNEFDPEPQPSRLRLSWTGHDFVETAQEVAGAASRRVSERWRITDLGEEWARRQLYILVETALRNC